MFENRSDNEVLDLVEGAHRQVAISWARTMAGIFELLERRTAEELDRDADVASMITAWRRTAAEVGAVLGLSTGRARHLVAQADALHIRMPAVGALLAAGEVNWETVEMVLKRTALVDEELIPQVDAVMAELIGGWARWSRKHICDAIDHEVARVDPEAVKERRVTAYDERDVTIEVGLDGMALVRATMSAQEGAALMTRLTAMAKSVCAGDPRTLNQRRLDAMTALHERRTFTCACPDQRCGASSSAAAEPPEPAERVTPAGLAEPLPRVVLHVIASAETVSGRSDGPGYLAGFGVVDAELVRELAREATWRLVDVPAFDERQALTYRPSAALARFIRARDLTCRFPGCSVPAERCDIDHTEPFNHEDPASGGWTVPWNLACYCREHHRLKTFDPGWNDRQSADGTIEWTTPAGKTVSTSPAGARLFPGLRKSRIAGDRRRVAAARHRLNAHRDDSRHNRYRNAAAKEEIRVRCWRNDFRRRHVLFKGHFAHETPNPLRTLARFGDDPLETEQLEPGWQPPPLDTAGSDDPPPF